ncbi:MAG TPA: TrkH family potassium uptake protein [Thermoanaerobaculaceae bacterium]|nr:TrkH family potassium uptake protein [Thermoanaerobaculaceae bacterium]HRS17670.1 TrkH family potassium uptake protein [Thermoanaerobaculaceae bacterium]
MNPRFDLHLLGWFSLLLAGLLLLPLPAALLWSETSLPWLGSAATSALLGLGVVLATRTRDRRLHPKDGFLVVTGAWLLASLVGALPFLLAGTLGPVDALFETVSGFTTTGSTVVVDTATLPRSLLLWRALTQWLGGMGIILFTIAILPLLGIGGMQLFRAEVPGPVDEKLHPRLATTARMLWGIYVGLTAAEWLGLRLLGVSSYEALCHALTTMATGGFSTRNGSIGEFGSPGVEWLVTLFMLLAGINFVLHFRLLQGRVRDVLKDVELRWFAAILGGALLVLTITLHRPDVPIGDTLRAASFQTVAIITTTGYVTADFEHWPHVAQLVLLLLMLVGGMSGSTGGGPKSLRLVLAFTSLRATIHRAIHPRAVVPVKYHGEVVEDEIISGVWGFLLAYALIGLAATGVVAAHGYDLLTAVSAAFTAIGNVGPGIGDVGPYDNFSHFPPLVKLALSFAMLVGRLEIFTVLALFSRRFWRH